jgi:hypothetical protein
LILKTERSFTLYVVGRVAADGQEDFSSSESAAQVASHEAAVDEAKRLAKPGSRIILRDIDTGEWSQISNIGAQGRSDHGKPDATNPEKGEP